MLQFGRPLYMGLSNKSWLSKLLGLGLEERGAATQVATALMAERGVGVHRVHDVKTTRETLRLVQEFGRIPCP
jgi:dihydropteroate synthase